PLTDRLAGGTHLPRHLRLAQSLSEQIGTLQTPLLQSLKIPPHSPWQYHTRNISQKPTCDSILCHHHVAAKSERFPPKHLVRACSACRALLISSRSGASRGFVTSSCSRRKSVFSAFVIRLFACVLSDSKSARRYKSRQVAGCVGSIG